MVTTDVCGRNVETIGQGIATVNLLMERLEIGKEDLVGEAYIDRLGTD